MRSKEIKGITLYQGESLKVMEFLAEQGIKVDAVITDVPFGTTQCSWDSVIPFAPMWEALGKITRDNTPILLHGAEPFSSFLRVSNIEDFKYDIIWDKIKGTGFLNAKIQPMRNHEFVHVFYKKQPTYNPQMTKGHSKKVSMRKGDMNTEVYGGMKSDYRYESTERYPRSIQVFSTDTQNSSLHPTQKPVKLLEYLVKTYTNEGGLVLDFTMGSGTTMVACANLNRRGIGVDNGEVTNKKSEWFGRPWVDVAEHRVKEAYGMVGLFA